MTDRSKEGGGAAEPQDVEELHGLLMEHYPDPVDELEDRLANEIGLRRHPSLPYPEWRRARVRGLDAAYGTVPREATRAPTPEAARRSGVNTPPGLAEQGDRVHARPPEV